jgi:ABC-type branched-subunit amino acid transport system ATPase component
LAKWKLGRWLTIMGLRVVGVSKQFAGFWALRRVSVALLPGSVSAFIGPNGAGKSTIFRLITGDLSPSEGAITLDDMSLIGLPPWRIAQLGIGAQFQITRLFDSMSALDNVVAALLRPDEYGLLSSLIRRRHLRVKLAHHREHARQWFDRLELTELVNKRARELSFGQRRLVNLVQLFSSDFRFLLLDEPTVGLAPSKIELVGQLLVQLARELEIGVCVIEHNLSFVSRFADYVCVICEGEVLAEGLPGEVLSRRDIGQSISGK